VEGGHQLTMDGRELQIVQDHPSCDRIVDDLLEGLSDGKWGCCGVGMSYLLVASEINSGSVVHLIGMGSVLSLP
jgi:hypothetical protein